MCPEPSRTGLPHATSVPLLDLREVAEAMRRLCDRAADGDGPPLEELVDDAVGLVPGARWASATMLRAGTFTTIASTDPAAERADALQYEIGSGPCVDSVLEGSLHVTGDVVADSRWPAWGERVASEVGVRSVLAQRLNLQDERGPIAALNLYSDQHDAFDDHSTGIALVLATHAAAVVSQSVVQVQAKNLLRALESNREIGVAMGILMHQHRFTREEAFDVLRVASQDSNRKLADVAAEVADTGVLEIPRRSAHPTAGFERTRD